jgi:Ni/Co efflux regulator RcnB
MKMHRTVPSLVAAVLAISLAGPGAALADDGHRYHDRHDYGSHQDRHHFRKHHQSRGHYDDRHHYKHYKKRHHYKHYDRAYRYDDNDDEKLLIGLVLGGLIGYAINNSYNANIYDH